MGWAVGKVDGRWVGYGVPAECDWPGCDIEIDRGLGWKCEEHPTYTFDPESEDETEVILPGCGFFFCGEHEWKSWDPVDQHDSVTGKPDSREWIMHQLIDPSWAKWRREEPNEVRRQQAQLAR